MQKHNITQSLRVTSVRRVTELLKASRTSKQACKGNNSTILRLFYRSCSFPVNCFYCSRAQRVERFDPRFHQSKLKDEEEVITNMFVTRATRVREFSLRVSDKIR